MRKLKETGSVNGKKEAPLTIAQAEKALCDNVQFQRLPGGRTRMVSRVKLKALVPKKKFAE